MLRDTVSCDDDDDDDDVAVSSCASWYSQL